MSAPYMPLFCGDYLGDTRHLTTEQHGAYLLLLMVMWRNDGFLPNDDRRLAQYSGLTQKKWQNHKSVILDFFEIDENKLFSSKMLSLLQKYDEKSRKNKISGEKGGKAKALKSNNNAQANANQSLSQPKPEPKPIDSVKDKSLPESNTQDEFQFSEKIKSEFQEFWEKYPNRCKEKQAKEAYEAARKQYSHEKIMDGLAQYIDAKPPDRAWMNPDNFLNNERFTDEPSPIKTKSNYRPNRPKVPDFNEVPFGGVSAKSCDLAVLGDETTIIDVQARRIA